MTTDRLLHDAVRDGASKGYGADRLDDLFAFLFRGLVYAQIWEDPALDMEAMALGPGHRVVTIGSGGCNAMSYLLAEPESVVAVDLNRAHVALARLKRDAVHHLPDYEHYFRFFGIGADPRNVEHFDDYLRERVDAHTRDYWSGRGLRGTRRIKAFDRGIYREGLLGRFITLLHGVLRLHGKRPGRVLEAATPDEQRRVFEEVLAPVLGGRLVRTACRLPIALYGLGIPPAQFRALADCADGDLPRLLHRRVEVELPALQQHAEGGARHGLRNAADAHFGEGRHRHAVLHIGPAKALREHDLSIHQHRRGEAGDLLRVHQRAEAVLGHIDGGVVAGVGGREVDLGGRLSVDGCRAEANHHQKKESNAAGDKHGGSGYMWVLTRVTRRYATRALIVYRDAAACRAVGWPDERRLHFRHERLP